MVSNGHPWSDIKNYTLSEIGSFFKTIVLLERNENVSTLSNMWMGNNLPYKELKEVLVGYGIKEQKATPTVAEVQNDWKKLASFLSKGS